MITVVLLDLDGVVRHFDDHDRTAVEDKHGLARGTLQAAAFETELLQLVVTGRITFEEWIGRVGDVVGNPTAARLWLEEKGWIDWDLVAVVDELRDSGVTVAVLTNGTDIVPDELDRLGATEHFDAIFNSAEIGYAKPDLRAFQHVTDRLGVDPGSVFFTDDSAHKLAGAVEAGMTARLYEGLDSFRAHLAELLP